MSLKVSLFLCRALLGLAILGTCHGRSGPSAFNDAISAGDQCYIKFDNQQALRYYHEAAEIQPARFDVLWRLARAHSDLGSDSKGEIQMQHYQLAEKFGRQCAEKFPDRVEGHFFLAVALGRVALESGSRKKVELSKEIKDEASLTLQIDPSHDGAMHVLGRWHYEISSANWLQRTLGKIIYGGILPAGSYESAKEWFEKAIHITPDNPAHHLWLGKTLGKLNTFDLARQHFERCLEIPNLFWDDAQNKMQAMQELRRIRSK